ncbi:MAG: hypothetical protein KAT46_07885, partial [Deltaproteobacteria bacterium]|nr:hypothetical protein [Deltaproteobacteria bacterium]
MGMKKILMLCVALVFFTTACGSGEAPVTDKSSEAPSAKTESAKTEGLPSGHPSTSEGATPMAMTGHPQGTTAKA